MFIVVEIDVLAYEELCLIISEQFCTINTLCFENQKEIFCQCIVVWLPRLVIDGVIPYDLVRLKCASEVY